MWQEETFSYWSELMEMYFIFSTVVDNILVESRLVSELIRARNSAEKSGIFIIIGVKLV